jgi:hypothetical protein
MGRFGLIFSLFYTAPNQYAYFGGENENYLHRQFSAKMSTAKSKKVHTFSFF